MPKLLLIEDDFDKKENVTLTLRSAFPEIDIDEAQSFNGALKKIATASNEYKLILLDMSMPNFDISINEPLGGAPESFAGREILKQMKLRRIDIPVIVITMFDSFGESSTKMSLKELDKELKQNFAPTYKGVIYYNIAQENWKEELLNGAREFIS